MKKYIKKQYIIIGLLVLVFSIFFIGNRYASDTYFLEAYGYGNNAFDPYFSAGRFAMTAYLGIMGLVDMPFEIMKIITYVLSVSFLTISSVLMYKTIDKIATKTEFFKIILSFMLIFNVFVIEYFYFTEYTAVVTLGILLSTACTYCIINYFKENKRKPLLLAILFAFLSTFCYQGTYALLVLLPITFTLFYAKNVKNFIKYNLIIAGIYAIPSFITLIITKIFENSRVKSDGSLLDNINNVFDGAKSLLVNTHEFLPRGFFLIIFAVVALIIIGVIIKERKEVIKKLVFLIYILLAVVIVTLVPSLITSDVWIMPRSNMGLGLLIPITLLFYIIYNNNNNNTKIKYILNIVVILLLSFQLVGNVNFAVKQYKNNSLTSLEMSKIENEIMLYESENNTTIKVLSLYKSENLIYNYPGISPTGDNNVRALSIEWAILPIFEVYFKDRYSYTMMEEEYEKTCEEKLENKYFENQVIFSEDIAYICIY